MQREETFDWNESINIRQTHDTIKHVMTDDTTYLFFWFIRLCFAIDKDQQ